MTTERKIPNKYGEIIFRYGEDSKTGDEVVEVYMNDYKFGTMEYVNLDEISDVDLVNAASYLFNK